MSLAPMIECTKSDIVATAEERNAAPTIAIYYDVNTAPNKYIEEVPDLRKYG